MTLNTQGAPAFAPTGTPGWLWDDVACEFVPMNGTTPADLVRGIGRLTAAPVGTTNTGATTSTRSRAVVNQLLPPGILFTAGTAGAEANTFTTRQDIAPAALTPQFNAASFGVASVANTIPAGALNLVGRAIRVWGGGTWGVTGTPNFTLDISLGGVVVATTTAFATSAVTSPQNFSFDATCTVQTAGATGKIFSAGTFTGNITALTVFPAAMANATPGTLATVDLTAALALTIGATWSVSNAANRIRLFGLTAEIVG